MRPVAKFLRAFAWLLFGLFGVSVFFAVPWYGGYSHLHTLLIGAIFLALLVLISRRENGLALHWSGKWHLGYVIALGVLVRLAWLYFVPPVQLSDSKDYLEAAARLAHTGEYLYIQHGEILRAWRAPGYPALLAVSITLVGENPWIPAFWNLIFFIGTAVAVYQLTERLAGRAAAIGAALLLSLWPSLIMITGLAQTESFSLFLLSAATLCWLRGRDQSLFILLAGLLTGIGALVRPSLLLFPLVWVADALMRDRLSLDSVKRIAIASICLAIVVLPWTLRNYRVIGAPIAVSSQGGDVFYRSNNPIATGTWSERGERDLTPFLRNEAQWNEVGYAWGKAWIAQHPVDFLKLSVKKLGIFFGADDTGAYWTLLRGHGNEGAIYRLSRLCSNLWWMIVWFAILAALWRARAFFTHSPDAAFLLVSALYLVAIHAVYESQARYHLPIVGLLCVIAALAFASRKSVPSKM